MNILQEILVAIFKSQFANIFYDALSTKEKHFIQAMKLLNFSVLRVIKTSSNVVLIEWKSTNDYQLAIPVGDAGFYFSRAGSYDEHADQFIHEENVPEEEIKYLKDLLLLFSVDAEVYFK